MAELPTLRRVGGAVESHRAPSGPRVLLPGEIQLCEAVGITEEEYWEFVRINEEYTGKRGAEYDHIPDIRNEPVSFTTVLTNLVIGLALTGVSMLLAPKPRTPKQKERPRLETGDQTSNSRFAPQSQFDSLQQLSRLGAIVPLVYCKTTGSGINQSGGVRVNSSLLWSHMITLGRSQQLRALMMFSHGDIDQKPDFAGFAIGDLLLENYALGKLALYFKTAGGRINHYSGSVDQYPNGMMEPPFDLSISSDPFAIKWTNSQAKQYFSGARTPSTQAAFGCYSCLPNGNRFKLNYELQLSPKDATDTVKDDVAAAKRRMRDWYPRYAYVEGNGRRISYSVGQQITYRISSNEVQVADIDRYGKRGIKDIRQSINNGRIDADNALVVGETYAIGTGLGVLIKKEGSPWRLEESEVIATFKATTAGQVDARLEYDSDEPNTLTIQRVAVATISNSRPCHRTDIIIKSIVFRKINGFANVNTQPDQETILKYEQDSGSIQLGQMNIFNRRLSFFALEYRKKGSPNWLNLTDTQTGFVVDGRSPEAVYNQLSIQHPSGSAEAYEYQLVPVAGAAASEFWGGNAPNTFPKAIYFLDAATSFDETWNQPKQQQFQHDGFTVWYTGSRKLFFRNENSNPDWQIFGVPPDEADSLYGVTFTNAEGTINLRPNDAFQDFVVYDSEELSNQSAPEHEIVSVNEIIDTGSLATYRDLAYAGVRLNSGAEWSSFSELSAYFKNGIKVQKLISGGVGATNLLPEIAYDLLTNTAYGAGDAVGVDQVDALEMQEAARFCEANQFFWNGVIGDRVNLREWLFENAGYCLLQFRIKGGRFSLYPDVPFDSGYRLDPNAPIEPKQLFTDTTINNLQVSFLTPEERQLFKATVLFRKDTINGFPETQSITVSLKVSNIDAPEETFDISGFCASREHAEIFAKYALKTRQLVDHGLKFQTTPQMAVGLEPGDYFRVASAAPQPVSGLSSSSRLKNGSIDSSGHVIALDLDNGNHDIQYWRPGTEGISTKRMSISNGIVSDPSLHGVIFAVSNNNPEVRTYKLESVTYAEDGLVEIAGSFAPLKGNALAVLDWDNQFNVET